MSALAGWGEFTAALFVFLISHGLPAQPRLRGPIVERLGSGTYLALYSVASVAVLVWLVNAAGRAPYVALWDFAPWQTWVPVVAMLPACLILALAAGQANPLSFGGLGNDRFDPARPGIVAVTRHPILAALALWAAGHVLPNGDLAHVILFGGFAALALLGMRMIDRRRKRQLGADAWDAMTRRSAAHAIADLARTGPFWARIAAGLLLYGALIALHPIVIGVPAWPVG